MKNIKNKKILLVVLVMVIVGLPGCAMIRDKLLVIRGDLIGGHFEISIYDHYANKTLDIEGNKVTVGLLENDANIDLESTGFQSGVLKIIINGDEMIQVGNTVIFAEKGLSLPID